MSNAHTTVIRTAEPIVAAASKRDEVVRVRPGRIRWRHGGHKSMKIQTLEGALKIRVAGDGAVQDIIVHSRNLDNTADALAQKWVDLYER